MQAISFTVMEFCIEQSQQVLLAFSKVFFYLSYVSFVKAIPMFQNNNKNSVSEYENTGFIPFCT